MSAPNDETISARVRRNRNGNATYELVLPDGNTVVVTWIESEGRPGRLRLDGPVETQLVQTEMYPGAGDARFTRVVWEYR